MNYNKLIIIIMTNIFVSSWIILNEINKINKQK